ncbi:NAD+ synthetase [Rippkaea orientalis PCC 8801]|uniref:Glutamine-dependent NAD(+) synthetase n=1 Tax=Rippkaea orientalis (strain PCC 8801 / RF-1) TaxID=41431 RepID=B7JWH1_RIPO1|nr:NAD+ synthase [Rippkaea orientalis]ACK67016.1 NAD+ synthetase [Rippkaea orientalis PCC 8801]
MKIAIAQLNPTIGDLVNNAHKILNAANLAASQNVRLLLTPELSLCGYPPRDLLLYPSFIKSLTLELQELAQKLPSQLAVLVGTVTPNNAAAINGEKPLFNSAALLENGEVKQLFHKCLLPNYDVFDEHRYFESGKQPNYFELFLDDHSSEPIKIGVTICEDLWNDEQFWQKRHYQQNPIKTLANLGVDLIVNLSASPYYLAKPKLRETMLQHTSKYYQIPLIYVNQIGGNDELIFDGNSFVVNEHGEIVLKAKSFAEDVKIFTWNKSFKKIVLASVNNFPNTEEEEIWSALVLGVKDYAQKCQFSKVILGLSGGIDSALVAAIATEAIGANNVLGILMPSPYSSDHSLKDAEKLVKNLGINHQTLPISGIMKTYDNLLNPLFSGTQFGIAEENLQARIRGNLLMAIANKFGYLLLSTGNKSEIAVGYCTLYGDMNGGLAVIADVPKTRVFSLCHWLNRHQEIIPHNILIKPPSAELKPNQTDQDSLPPYEILDEILERRINHHQSFDEICEAGFNANIVQKVLKLVARAEFKRKQAPLVLKVTDKAFGTGWRMPIASQISP